MRVTFPLIGILTLLVGACAAKNEGTTHAPPPLNKDLLRGKWKRETDVLFRTKYEFGNDGIVKITFQNMKEPIKARYGWSGERTVEVVFPTDEEVRKDYEAAAKAYKEDVKDKIEKKKLSHRGGPAILNSVADKMPEKETYHVGISDPKLLILTMEDSNAMNFQRENE